MEDEYKTIASPSEEIMFKEKKSKFYGYAFPISSEEEIKPFIETLRKKHHTANHVCYAWQIGVDPIKYRSNDDGEPNNSAGAPIYGQIQAFGVTNILVAVPRIFGGTKLGVGGLIQAYKTAAQLALENSKIITKTLRFNFTIEFLYPEMNKVMRIIKKEKIKIESQSMTATCIYNLSVRKGEAEKIRALFKFPLKVNLRTFNEGKK